VIFHSQSAKWLVVSGRLKTLIVGAGIAGYQRRQQLKVVAAQKNSRTLAHLMMVRSPALSWGCEKLLHLYGPKRALGDIIKVMDGHDFGSLGPPARHQTFLA
jgi:hypothetical protein